MSITENIIAIMNMKKEVNTIMEAITAIMEEKVASTIMEVMKKIKTLANITVRNITAVWDSHSWVLVLSWLFMLSSKRNNSMLSGLLRRSLVRRSGATVVNGKIDVDQLHGREEDGVDMEDVDHVDQE
jgi:hypothetical protein